MKTNIREGVERDGNIITIDLDKISWTVGQILIQRMVLEQEWPQGMMFCPYGSRDELLTKLCEERNEA